MTRKEANKMMEKYPTSDVIDLIFSHFEKKINYNRTQIKNVLAEVKKKKRQR